MLERGWILHFKGPPYRTRHLRTEGGSEVSRNGVPDFREPTLAADGIGNHAIARAVGCALQTVKTWRKRYASAHLAALQDRPRSGRPPTFGPRTLVQVKAIACELPAERGLPRSRFSISDLHTEIRKERILPLPSRTTLWRILHEDGIRPWFYRTWIHKRAPDFLEKAGPILDLYTGTWEGKPLDPMDRVICADEKTSIQILERLVPTRPPRAGEGGKVEFEYRRHGTITFVGGLEVRSGKLFGAFPERNDAESFRKFVGEVMGRGVCPRSSGLLGRGQRERAPPEELRPVAALDVPERPGAAHPGACELGGPGGDRALHPDKEGAHPAGLPVAGGGEGEDPKVPRATEPTPPSVPMALHPQGALGGPEAVGGRGQERRPSSPSEGEVSTKGRGTIPEDLQKSLRERLEAHASKAWKGRYDRLEVSFRGRFAWVDAYLLDEETGEGEEVATHLCRLEYVGRPDRWGFAFYKYSEERYERSYLPSGAMGGTPEECLDTAGLAYLS